jgi:hypothetical protein
MKIRYFKHNEIIYKLENNIIYYTNISITHAMKPWYTSIYNNTKTIFFKNFENMEITEEEVFIELI